MKRLWLILFAPLLLAPLACQHHEHMHHSESSSSRYESQTQDTLPPAVDTPAAVATPTDTDIQRTETTRSTRSTTIEEK